MVETRRLRLLVSDAAVTFPPGPLLVALSGGADSAVAAWLAARSGVEARAVHVHHGLAGSDVLEAAAREIAIKIGLDFTLRHVELERESEGEARLERYAALGAERHAREWIVTGHTADDQAETVMINLLRSAGSEGLSGIPRSRWPLVRPLLGMWRAQTREMAALAGLPFVDDPANQDLRHLRNRVRTVLFPEIEGSYNPSFRESLARTAEAVASEASLLERISSDLRIERIDGSIRFVAGELAAVDPATAARVIRRALTRERPPHPPSFVDVSRVMAVATGEATAGTVAGGGTVERSGPWLVITWDDNDVPPGSSLLACPGLTGFGRFGFEATVIDTRPVRPLSMWALVLADGPPLSVAAAAEGGFIGKKSVEAALAEARVGRPARKSWPVVRRSGEVIWIPGVRRAGWPDSGEERYLCVVATEEKGWARFER